MIVSRPHPSSRQRPLLRPGVDLILRLVGYLCLVAGLALIGAFGYGMVGGILQSRHDTAAWSRQLASTPPPAAAASGPPANLLQPVNGVDFAIRVPKLGYYAAVREGVSLGVLYSGPGHYAETPWPGQAGMVGVAAHNVYWIDFPQLAKGDEVDLETRYGTF